ncbi:MAG: hypothetical protein JJU05_08970 [Verrucomicrobia bacterium]|nr:hypothetical protein [Verrucomicrobiota bacterium]MCH8526978.1 hypothetical protein [Kiritimatiellia bacterium]
MRRINHFPGDLTSTVFSLHIDYTEIPVTVSPGIDPGECEKLSAFLQSMPHENMRLPPRLMAYHYAHVVNAGGVASIQVNEPINSFAVYPLRKHIRAGVDGDDKTRLCLSLRDDAPCLIVQINKLPVFCLILENKTPAQTGRELRAGREMLDFRSFTTPSDRDHTDAFRQAFREINDTGRTLHIPAGIYQTEPLRLHNARNCHIHFSAGALINIAIGAPGENRRAGAGLWLHECENVVISGLGCLDQRSCENFGLGRNDYAAGMQANEYWQSLQPVATDDPLMQSPLFITNSSRITIHDLTLRNGRVWNINVKNSDHLHFARCKVLSPPASNPEWLDGFNLGGCRDVLIEDCLMVCNDDPFAGAHHMAPYLDGGDDAIRVLGLVGYNPRANGVRLGWACKSPQGSYDFENCDFIGCSGIVVHALPDNLRYGAIRFRNCGFDQNSGIRIQGVERLEFTDVTFSRSFQRMASISDTDNLLIQNSFAGGQPLLDALHLNNVTQIENQ